MARDLMSCQSAKLRKLYGLIVKTTSETLVEKKAFLQIVNPSNDKSVYYLRRIS